MCKKIVQTSINNINVPGQRICSHFLVQIPRADAEIVTNKLPLIFFLIICYFCILMYNIPTRIFTDFRVFVYKSNLYFFSYEIAEFRIQELFEPLFKEK